METEGWRLALLFAATVMVLVRWMASTRTLLHSRYIFFFSDALTSCASSVVATARTPCKSASQLQSQPERRKEICSVKCKMIAK